MPFAKINPDLGRFLISLGDLMPKDGLYAYLIYMARRLQELHRILKPTGSIYLHVDDTASHYLKLIMDSIFGSAQYQNNISWHACQSQKREAEAVWPLRRHESSFLCQRQEAGHSTTVLPFVRGMDIKQDVSLRKMRPAGIAQALFQLLMTPNGTRPKY